MRNLGSIGVTRLSANKYSARRTWSSLCERWFASRREAEHGEYLRFLELAGEIDNLTYQVTFTLSKDPKVTITIDFMFTRAGRTVYQDAKGVLTRDFRTKLAWLKQLHGIEVELV